MSDYIERDESNDGIDRRGFLKCMAWAGAGVIWVMKGGILSARAFGADADPLRRARLHARRAGRAGSHRS